MVKKKSPKRIKRLILRVKKSEINNLYRPNGLYESESYDEVIVHTTALSNKFLHIVLFEWLLLVKVSGKLILSYTLSRAVTVNDIEKKLWWIGKGKYEIIEHKEKGSFAQLTLRKTKQMDENHGLMDEWSFGIVTNGDRDDWIEEIIQSIRNLNIPKYEIIVCGRYKDRKEKNFTYINFTQRSERGWINKKKNLIAQKASYENMCIVHDRLVFDKSWHIGMKRYGNGFAILGCVQKEKNTGENAGDWLTLGGPDGTRWKISRLVQSDWDYYGFIGGQMVIIKKSIWDRVQWDETRYWDGADDADWDIIFRARDMGYITRFNPYAKMTAITWRHGKLPLKHNISDGLFPKDMIARRVMRTGARFIDSVPVVNRLMQESAKYIIKTRLYKYFIYH